MIACSYADGCTAVDLSWFRDNPAARPTFRNAFLFHKDKIKKIFGTFTEAIASYSADETLGYVFRSNDEDAKVMTSMIGVGQHFDLIVQKTFVGLVYTKAKYSRVITDGSKMSFDFRMLLPTAYYATDFSMLSGQLPSSYISIDGKCFGVYESCSGLLDADQLVYEGSKLVAAFGVKSGSLNLSYLPLSKRSAIIHFANPQLADRTFGEINSAYGLYFSGSMRSSATKFFNALVNGTYLQDPTWCKVYPRPTSESMQLAAMPSFVCAFGDVEPTRLEAGRTKPVPYEYIIFMGDPNDPTSSDGEHITEWINTGCQSPACYAKYYVSNSLELKMILSDYKMVVQEMREQAAEQLAADINQGIIDLHDFWKQYGPEISATASGHIDDILKKYWDDIDAEHRRALGELTTDVALKVSVDTAAFSVGDVFVRPDDVAEVPSLHGCSGLLKFIAQYNSDSTIMEGVTLAVDEQSRIDFSHWLEFIFGEHMLRELLKWFSNTALVGCNRTLPADIEFGRHSKWTQSYCNGKQTKEWHSGPVYEGIGENKKFAMIASEGLCLARMPVLRQGQQDTEFARILASRADVLKKPNYKSLQTSGQEDKRFHFKLRELKIAIKYEGGNFKVVPEVDLETFWFEGETCDYKGSTTLTTVEHEVLRLMFSGNRSDDNSFAGPQDAYVTDKGSGSLCLRADKSSFRVSGDPVCNVAYSSIKLSNHLPGATASVMVRPSRRYMLTFGNPGTVTPFLSVKVRKNSKVAPLKDCLRSEFYGHSDTVLLENPYGVTEQGFASWTQRYQYWYTKLQSSINAKGVKYLLSRLAEFGELKELKTLAELDNAYFLPSVAGMFTSCVMDKDEAQSIVDSVNSITNATLMNANGSFDEEDCAFALGSDKRQELKRLAEEIQGFAVDPIERPWFAKSSAIRIRDGVVDYSALPLYLFM